MNFILDISQKTCYNKNTIKSARGTAPLTARQPARAVRWQRLNDGCFFHLLVKRLSVDGRFFAASLWNIKYFREAFIMSVKRTVRALSRYEGRVYVYLKDHRVGEQFLRTAESEGFTFGDGARRQTYPKALCPSDGCPWRRHHQLCGRNGNGCVRSRRRGHCAGWFCPISFGKWGFFYQQTVKFTSN